MIIVTEGGAIQLCNKDYDIVRFKKSYAYRKTNFNHWSIKIHGNNRYAYTRVRVGKNKWKLVFMHRLILGITDPKISVDHKNGNGLDNRRCNLRACSQSENIANSRTKNHSSEFKGVSWSKPANKWIAQLMYKGKNFYLGSYDSERRAAIVYNIFACKAFGRHVRLNDV